MERIMRTSTLSGLAPPPIVVNGATTRLRNAARLGACIAKNQKKKGMGIDRA